MFNSSCGSCSWTNGAGVSFGMGATSPDDVVWRNGASTTFNISHPPPIVTKKAPPPIEKTDDDMPTVGDIKYGLQTTDHGGWYIFDGRPVSSLQSVTARSNAALLFGATNNIPDLRGKLLRAATAPGDNLNESGTDSLTITTDNLPTNQFIGSTDLKGAHTHTVNTTGSAAGATATGTTGPESSHSHSISVTTNEGGHSHAISTSGAHGHTLGDAGSHWHYCVTNHSTNTGIADPAATSLALNNLYGSLRTPSYAATDTTGAHTHTVNTTGDHNHSITADTGRHDHSATCTAGSAHTHDIDLALDLSNLTVSSAIDEPEPDHAHAVQIVLNETGSQTAIDITPSSTMANCFGWFGY